MNTNNKKQTKIDDILDEFNDVKKNQENVKFIKKDKSIIERVDRIIVESDGRQLLREQY
jgi:hypothetical protein